MKRVLTVGMQYTGTPIEGVEFEQLGLCRSDINDARAAYPLYEYDVIVINPQSYSHFLFGKEGVHSGSDQELLDLKKDTKEHDLDAVFDSVDRQNELESAMAAGATVVWCMAEPRRMNFFGYRETSLGYLAPAMTAAIRRGGQMIKKGRRVGFIDPDTPFASYFDDLSSTGGWRIALENDEPGLTTIAATPEGYQLGARVEIGATTGWLMTPPLTQEATNRLILGALAVSKAEPDAPRYHGIFLSHTSADKPFLRKLRRDLMARGVPKVWLDEAEIQVGDSLIEKIDEGMAMSRYVGVVLSQKSIAAPWVKKELDVAMNREISSGEVVVLPMLYEECDIPTFLRGKLYADFSSAEKYEEGLEKLLRRLRI